MCLTGNAWHGVIQEYIPVEPGKRYKITYKYFKDPSIERKSSAAFYVRYDKETGVGNRKGEIQLTAGWMTDSDGDWVTYSTTFVAPAGVTSVAFDLRTPDPASLGGQKGIMYIDEISLKEVR